MLSVPDIILIVAPLAKVILLAPDVTDVKSLPAKSTVNVPFTVIAPAIDLVVAAVALISVRVRLA